MPRVEVLDEHVGHAGVGGQGAQQLPEGLQAAGGRADADDRERSLAARPRGRFDGRPWSRALTWCDSGNGFAGASERSPSYSCDRLLRA